MDAGLFKGRMKMQLSGSTDDCRGVSDEEKFIRSEVEAILERVIAKAAFAKKREIIKIHVMSLHEGDYDDLPKQDGSDLSPIAAAVARIIIDAGFLIEYRWARVDTFHMYLRLKPAVSL